MKYCRFINKVIVDKKIYGYNIEFFDDLHNTYTRFVNKDNLHELSNCVIINAVVRKNNSVLSDVSQVYQEDGITINTDGTLSDGSRRFIKLYHGSKSHRVEPTHDKGNGISDFGKGFYLYPSHNIASEWASSDRYNVEPDANVYTHEYNLYLDGLEIFDFRKSDVLSWVAYVLSHRDVAIESSHRNMVKSFVDKYAPNTAGYDVLIGWRADASFFYLIEKFVLGDIDVVSLKDILTYKNIDMQAVLKSSKAIDALEKSKVHKYYIGRYYKKYNKTDVYIRGVIDKASEECKTTLSEDVFSNLAGKGTDGYEGL